MATKYAILGIMGLAWTKAMQVLIDLMNKFAGCDPMGKVRHTEWDLPLPPPIPAYSRQMGWRRGEAGEVTQSVGLDEPLA